jgi:hypothetical protein
VTSVLTPQIAFKSMAALGIVGAATASVVVPAAGQAAPVTSTVAGGAGTSPALAATLIESRTAAVLGASRSSARTSIGQVAGVTVPGDRAGVAAPAVSAPTVTGTVGIGGFEAVAKPAADTNLDKLAGQSGQSGQSGQGVASVTTAAGSVYVGGGYSASEFAGWCRGLGLTANAAAVCSAARSLFGISNIGGYRAGDWGDHGSGQAVDVMTSDFAQGDAVAAFFQEHAAEFNIKYLIWKQRYWAPGGSWSLMEDRGSPTQNHMDHVHVSVN